MVKKLVTDAELGVFHSVQQRWSNHICKYDRDGTGLCEQCPYGPYDTCILNTLITVTAVLRDMVIHDEDWGVKECCQ